jgi:hypothetical protein
MTDTPHRRRAASPGTATAMRDHVVGRRAVESALPPTCRRVVTIYDKFVRQLFDYDIVVENRGFGRSCTPPGPVQGARLATPLQP